jgi:AraC-like DNA-binding protein
MKDEDFFVRAAALHEFGAILADFGCAVSPILKQCGIEPESLDNPDTLIRYRDFLEALHLACEATGLPSFGLHLATRQPMTILGPLGFAMAEAPCLGAALKKLADYFHLHSNGGVVQLVVQDGTACWRYEILMSNLPGIHVQEDLAAALGVKFIRQFLGSDWEPDYVTLQRRTPPSIGPYRALFRCPIHFEADSNQLVFCADLLNQPLASGNNQLHGILNQHLQMLDTSFAAMARTDVQKAILLCLKLGDSSLRHVAARLGTTPRSLQRRLQQEGLHFREELDHVRVRIAKRHLEESKMSVTDLSDLLGFSDLAAFSRAFRRLTGFSPRQWRQSVPAPSLRVQAGVTD